MLTAERSSPAVIVLPHLRVDINQPDDAAVDREIATRFERLFAEIMETGTDHIAIGIGHHATHGLALGRVEDAAQGVALVNADIRAGRSLDQRRRLALGFMEILHELTTIPTAHMYVTFTQHPGEDFHLVERYLGDWHAGDRPLE